MEECDWHYCNCNCRYDRRPTTGCNASGLCRADGFPWSADVGADDAPAFQMIASVRGRATFAFCALGETLKQCKNKAKQNCHQRLNYEERQRDDTMQVTTKTCTFPNDRTILALWLRDFSLMVLYSLIACLRAEVTSRAGKFIELFSLAIVDCWVGFKNFIYLDT